MELTVRSDDDKLVQVFGELVYTVLSRKLDQLEAENEALRKAARLVTQYYPITKESTYTWMQVRKQDYDALVEALGEEAD